MRKNVILIMAAIFSTATISACAGNNTPETNLETVVTEECSPVEIIYFHGKQRCMTCMAIEKEAKALVEGELAQQVKDGKVKFRVVDISSEEGKKLATQYKVTFSSLFVVSNGTEDLTRFAFANARSNAEGFRKELKDKVVKAIK